MDDLTKKRVQKNKECNIGKITVEDKTNNNKDSENECAECAIADCENCDEAYDAHTFVTDLIEDLIFFRDWCIFGDVPNKLPFSLWMELISSNWRDQEPMTKKEFIKFLEEDRDRNIAKAKEETKDKAKETPKPEDN